MCVINIIISVDRFLLNVPHVCGKRFMWKLFLKILDVTRAINGYVFLFSYFTFVVIYIYMLSILVFWGCDFCVFYIIYFPFVSKLNLFFRSLRRACHPLFFTHAHIHNDSSIAITFIIFFFGYGTSADFLAFFKVTFLLLFWTRSILTLWNMSYTNSFCCVCVSIWAHVRAIYENVHTTCLYKIFVQTFRKWTRLV